MPKTYVMFPMARRGHHPLGRVMDDLPEDWHVLLLEEGHLVVGPTGAFALTTAADVEVDDAAHRIARCATRLREALVERLSWAPFVDSLVVVDGPPGTTSEASVVPPRLLADVLTNGRRLLERDDIDRIVATLGGLHPVVA